MDERIRMGAFSRCFALYYYRTLIEYLDGGNLVLLHDSQIRKKMVEGTVAKVREVEGEEQLQDTPKVRRIF